MARMEACYPIFRRSLLVALAVQATGASSSTKAAFDVQAQVLSGWARTPSAAQSLEWLRDVDDDEAAIFLKQLGQNPAAADAVNLTTAEAHLQSSSARVFHELLVRNSYYSPRIEMLRSVERMDRGQYGKDCKKGAAWALVWRAGKDSPDVACDAKALKAAFSSCGQSTGASKSSSFRSSQLDLLLRTGSLEDVAVLYGDVSVEGLETLSPLLKEVEALPATSQCRVLFRHGDGPEGPNGPGADVLTGWGFELAIKSSEYKTHAEDKKDGEKSEGNKGDEDGAGLDGDLAQEQEKYQLSEPLELDGLQFHVLLKRHKRIAPKLWAFKEQLEVARDTDKLLKAWEIEDIGLQATARIKSSPTPLLTLMRVSQDFPGQVVGLARTTVPETLRRNSNRLRQVIREKGEVFSVNSRTVRADHSELSLFPLVKTLLPVFIGIERMVRHGLSEIIACDVLKESHQGKAPERLDWRSPSLPQPVYHVLKDKQTRNWGSQLREMLYAYPGGLAPVRIPLYSIVFVLDPSEVADLRIAHQLLSQLPLPASVHLVLLPGPSADASGLDWDEQALGHRPDWLPAIAGEEDRSSGPSVSAAISAAFGHLLEKNIKKARNFVKALVEYAAQHISAEDGKHTWPDNEASLTALSNLFSNVAEVSGAEKEKTWKGILKFAALRKGYLANTTEYVSTLGVPVPSMLLNGKVLLRGAFSGSQSFFPTLHQEQQVFQRAVYMGQLTDASKVDDFIASHGLIAAYHEDIAPEMAQRGGEDGMPGQTATEVQYHQWPARAFLDLPFVSSLESDDSEDAGRLRFFHVVALRRLSHAYLLHSLSSHLLKPGRTEGSHSFSSHLSILVDEGSVSGAEKEVLAELGICIRGALALKVSNDLDEDEHSISRQRLLLLKFLGSAAPAAAAALSQGGKGLGAKDMQRLCDLAIEKKITPALRSTVQELVKEARAHGPGSYEAALLRSTQGHTGGSKSTHNSTLWVVNGHLIVLEEGDALVSSRHARALELLEAQLDLPSDSEEGGASQSSIKALHERLARQDPPLPVQAQGLIAAIRSEALVNNGNGRFSNHDQLFQQIPAAFRLHLPPAKPEAASPLKVFGILDPLSPTAQSASAVLALFGMTFNAEVDLVFNPVLRHSEYPLKRYYREVIQWPQRLADGRALSDLGFGMEVGANQAKLHMATKHTLTAAVHALPTWLVTAHEAEHDMDNLRQVDVGDGKLCETTYVLRQLYVEGQAFVLGDDGWPITSARNLQIDLTATGEQEASGDTIVMGNLGYFQVHGNPGTYEVSLKPGLSNSTFELASRKNLEVSSYITPPYQLRVRLQPGKKMDDLWEGVESRRKGAGSKGVVSQVWSGLMSAMGRGQEKGAVVPGPEGEEEASEEEELPTIHIFSVASGHLYEKLLGIMILSVRNRTSCPLHFWFIDNFLSPKFKAFIPQMAKRYKFGFDFITYKWPSWLNPQSEKQRLIWAYKVLFLDVLFPLHVPKVLFIDADQVVRADVRELWDTDLQGKVYGFVPMGDTNPDTEGFRFWKQGYWKNHLQGLPYHISALYVVDLTEFRRTSTGDRLREIYNQLSRDPNSLSNLEQDLLNFAQHQVPIHSLPAEWLWCETWCSQESKPRAKTIDLCQNPLTKEPKIVMAKRIIAEWQTYHDEVQRFQEGLFSSLSPPTPSNAQASSQPSQGKAEL